MIGKTGYLMLVSFVKRRLLYTLQHVNEQVFPLIHPYIGIIKPEQSIIKPDFY